MESSEKNFIRMNIFTYILLIYILAILCCDYFSYFFSLNYIPALVLGFGISGLFFFLLRKKIKIKNDFEKSDFIFFSFLLLICIITIIFPDQMFDSLNYHLFNQEQPFKDVTNKYFFLSSNINSTTFALGDRLFYPMRLLLGYRLGLILNYIYLIIIYYQVKKLMKYFIKADHSIFIAIMATLSVLTLSILDIVDTYYVDLLSVVCLLELVSFCFLGDQLSSNKNDNILELSLISFWCGLSFCIKLSNAFFVIILFFLYWYYHKDLFKKINLKIIILVIASFILPFFVYMLWTYLETGNPVFPFYNQIFHSKYLASVSWMDTRLGPKGIVETLIWPIKMLWEPSRANDVYIIEPMWAFTYLTAMFYVAQYIIKKILKKKCDEQKFILAVVVIVFYFLWGKFSLGYIRYGLFILLLGEILVSAFLVDVYQKKQIIFIPLIILGLSYNSYYFINKYVKEASYISFHNLFSEGISSYKYNVKHLFDKDNTIISLPDHSALGPLAFDSGYLYLMDKKDSIVNLFIHKEHLASEYYQQKLNEIYYSYEQIYSGFATFKANEFIEHANNFGYEIESFYHVYKPTFLSENEVYYLFKIKKVDIANNTFSSQNELVLDVEQDKMILNGIVGINSYCLNTYDEVYLEIIDENKQIKFHQELDIQEGSLYDISEEIDTSNTATMTMRLVNAKGEQLTDIEFITINLKMN